MPPENFNSFMFPKKRESHFRDYSRKCKSHSFHRFLLLLNFCIHRNYQISHEISDNKRLRSEMEARFERVLARDSSKSISSTMFHYNRRQRERERERSRKGREEEGKHAARNYDPSNGIRGLRSSGVSVGIMRRQQEIRKRRRGNT